MAIEVTARHMQANERVQSYAKEKGDALTTEFPSVEHVHVILDVEKRDCLAEVVVQARNHVKVEATDRAESMRVAIDLAVDKVEKQLRKVRDKVRDHSSTRKHFEARKAVGGETETET